jgi:hypothetical protein
MTKILRIKYIDGKRIFTLVDKPVYKSYREINQEKLMKLKNSGKRIEIQTPWETQPRIYYNDELVELPYERWKLTVDCDVVYHLRQLTHDPRKPRPEGWETRQFEKSPPKIKTQEDTPLFFALRKAIFNR